MKNKNACVNSHEPVLSSSSMKNPIAELGCSFTKVRKNGKPALLACLNIQAQTTATDTLSALLHHTEELNLRLPSLRVSVRINTEATVTTLSDAPESYVFVLHGISHRSITKRNIANFLDRLTHDFKVFLSYAKAHNIQLQPTLKDSAVRPLV